MSFRIIQSFNQAPETKLEKEWALLELRSSLCLCDCGQILPLYTVIFSPMETTRLGLGLTEGSRGLNRDKMLKCLAMEASIW